MVVTVTKVAVAVAGVAVWVVNVSRVVSECMLLVREPKYSI